MFKPALLSSNEKTIFCLAQELIKKEQLSNAAQLIQSGLAENPDSEILRNLFQSVLATQLGTRRFIE